MIALNKKLLSKFKGKEFKIINLKEIIGEREISQLLEREKDPMGSVLQREREEKASPFFPLPQSFYRKL